MALSRVFLELSVREKGAVLCLTLAGNTAALGLAVLSGVLAQVWEFG